MAVALTEKQQEVLKSMVEFAEIFADEMLKIMKHHGLDRIEGCGLSVSIQPEFLFETEVVRFGNEYAGNAGIIRLSKGRRCLNEKFTPTGKNSPEYELLFADEAVRERMEKILHREKPLPPDGLWVGDPRNDSPVDSRWEWDINDSLS